MILVASVVSPSLHVLRAMTSRSVIMSLQSVISRLALILWYAATLGHSVSCIGHFGRIICHPGNETVLYSWLIFSHQVSCTRKTSYTGPLLSAIMYIAACMAAFDQFMFKLQSEIKVFNLACSLM